MQEIKIEEKIDFIYKTLKKQEERKRFFLFLKIFLWIFWFLFVTYMYYFWINQIISWVKNSINQTIIEKKDNAYNFLKEKTKNLKENIKNINY